MKPKLKRDWIGRRVRTLRVLSSQAQEIPAGTIMTVRANRGGLRLAGDPCQCCGVRVFIRGIAESSVELLDAQA